MRIHISTFVFLFGIVSSSFGIDDAKLKDRLKGGVFELVAWENFDVKQLGATDDQLYRVLMEIFREAEGKWKTLTPKTPEWGQNRNLVTGVFACLPLCGVPSKNFLLDYAVSKEKEIYTREAAICSYLRVADAEETKNVLLRFLVENDRMGSSSRLGIYSFARTTYDQFALPPKKYSILGALTVAADREEGKIEFMKVDGILAERSAAYRRSRERLVMLERHNLEPPTSSLYVDRDLQTALKECRKYKQYTNVNTNLAIIKVKSFDLFYPEMKKNDLLALTLEEIEKKKSKEMPLIIGLGFVAGLAAAAGVWFYRKKRAV